MIDQAFDISLDAPPLMRIAILDETTANQIAAGEVIERPASVVKELVENAVDAGARRIVIELEGSGKRLIRVIDDGCGMSQEDAILSLQRHATSKIRSVGDLAEIVSMGFRGEALPSIASVAQVEIVTRLAGVPADRPGTALRIVGGEMVAAGEIGARAGTSITVGELFYNVPARLKFLKTDSTELHHILELIQRQALARPEVAFRLTHHGREIFASSGSGLLSDVCLQVYGRQVARRLLPIDYDSGSGTRVTGLLGPPETFRGTRAGQHLFVNRRFVRDRAIARALDDGYRAVQTIHGHQYPPAVILVEVDPADVDVNVSPTKTEVRFLREREVFSAVYRAVQQTLMHQGGLSPTIATHALSESRPGSPTPYAAQYDFGSSWQSPFERKSAPIDAVWLPPAGERSADSPQPAVDPFDDQPAQRAQSAESPAEEAGQTAVDRRRGDRAAPHRETLIGMRVLGQTRSMYILAQTDRSLLVIDQHIAHERVLYERLLKGHAERSLAIQHLVVPVTLELGRREALVVQERIADLERAGFLLEPFGTDTFLLRGVPAMVAQKQSAERVIRAIIDELVEKTISRRLLVPGEEVLITASCKMAVKAGDPLAAGEMQALIDDLLACENPYTCPHGRPIIIEIPNMDLDRKFGRA